MSRENLDAASMEDFRNMAARLKAVEALPAKWRASVVGIRDVTGDYEDGKEFEGAADDLDAALAGASPLNDEEMDERYHYRILSSAEHRRRAELLIADCRMPGVAETDYDGVPIESFAAVAMGDRSIEDGVDSCRNALLAAIGHALIALTPSSTSSR